MASDKYERLLTSSHSDTELEEVIADVKVLLEQEQPPEGVHAVLELLEAGRARKRNIKIV